jgi:hypothetical protein
MGISTGEHKGPGEDSSELAVPALGVIESLTGFGALITGVEWSEDNVIWIEYLATVEEFLRFHHEEGTEGDPLRNAASAMWAENYRGTASSEDELRNQLAALWEEANRPLRT